METGTMKNNILMKLPPSLIQPPIRSESARFMGERLNCVMGSIVELIVAKLDKGRTIMIDLKL